jgi:proline dehydrogenase
MADSASAPKKKSRGARLSKAEREARRDARLAAAQTDAEGGEALEARSSRLLQLVAAEQWNEALSLGSESLPLAVALVRALLPIGRDRQVAHAARSVAKTVRAADLGL